MLDTITTLYKHIIMKSTEEQGISVVLKRKLLEKIIGNPFKPILTTIQTSIYDVYLYILFSL